MSKELTEQEDLITRTVRVWEPSIGAHYGLADITLLLLLRMIKGRIYDTYTAKARSGTLKSFIQYFIKSVWSWAYVPTPLL